MLSARHDLVGTKGNKLGAVVVAEWSYLPLFLIILHLCKYYFTVGVFQPWNISTLEYFNLGIREVQGNVF